MLPGPEALYASSHQSPRGGGWADCCAISVHTAVEESLGVLFARDVVLQVRVGSSCMYIIYSLGGGTEADEGGVAVKLL